MKDKSFSYTKAMQEVEAILADLEKDNPDIDLMSRQVERAVELLQACKDKLYNTDEEIKRVFEQLNNPNK